MPAREIGGKISDFREEIFYGSTFVAKRFAQNAF